MKLRYRKVPPLYVIPRNKGPTICDAIKNILQEYFNHIPPTSTP